jgi:hypothetical protein
MVGAIVTSTVHSRCRPRSRAIRGRRAPRKSCRSWTWQRLVLVGVVALARSGRPGARHSPASASRHRGGHAAGARSGQFRIRRAPETSSSASTILSATASIIAHIRSRIILTGIATLSAGRWRGPAVSCPSSAVCSVSRPPSGPGHPLGGFFWTIAGWNLCLHALSVDAGRRGGTAGRNRARFLPSAHKPPRASTRT